MSVCLSPLAWEIPPQVVPMAPAVHGTVPCSPQRPLNLKVLQNSRADSLQLHHAAFFALMSPTCRSGAVISSTGAVLWDPLSAPAPYTSPLFAAWLVLLLSPWQWCGQWCECLSSHGS